MNTSDKPLKKKSKLNPSSSSFNSSYDNNVFINNDNHPYYLHNFNIIINESFERYSSILSSQEILLYHKWNNLSYDTKKLYIRLFLRKPNWFRINGLDQRYSEINNLLSNVIPELFSSNFAISSKYLLTNTIQDTKDNSNELTQLLFSILTRKELENIINKAQLYNCISSPLTKRKRIKDISKLQLVLLIVSNYFPKSSNISNKIPKSSSYSNISMKQKTLQSFFISSPKSNNIINNETNSSFLLPDLIENTLNSECISLSKDSIKLFKILQHLFFLSPWQDQTLLVLSDMDKIRFPSIITKHAQCNKGKYTGIFKTRKQFEEYQQSLFLEMELNYALTKLRPSSLKQKSQNNKFSSSFCIWKINIDEVPPLENIDDSILLRYNYNCQFHLDTSPQDTLIRIIHHCCLHLYTNSYKEYLDPYRNITKPKPKSLGIQLQSMISRHNSSFDNNSQLSLERTQSDPLLHQNKISATQPNINPIKQVKKEKIEQDDNYISSSAPVRVKKEKIESINDNKETIDNTNNNKNIYMEWMDRFTCEWVMARILSHAVVELEKQKDYNSVVCIYRLLLSCERWSISRRGSWWDRLSLVLSSHLRNSSYALSVSLLGLEDPLIPFEIPERISLRNRVIRLYKPPLRWSSAPKFSIIHEAPKKYIKGILLSSSVGYKNKWKSLDSNDNTDIVSVEQLALQWYYKQGWHGIHCEGGIIYPLFSMLLFDVIFADIPLVFQSKFQDAPLDLLTKDFYKQRKHLFKQSFKILSNLSNNELSQKLEEFWNNHKGEQIQSIDWNRYPIYLLQTISCCFGGKRLVNIFKIIVKNYKSSRSGMPDLLLWKKNTNNKEEEQNEILFSEVKGPRDRLSSKQYLWIHKMIENNIPIEVLHVKEDK